MVYTRVLCLRRMRLGGERRTKELFSELVRREEMLFNMVSGIRLDVDKLLANWRELDIILTRIMRIEENDSSTSDDVSKDGR